MKRIVEKISNTKPCSIYLLCIYYFGKCKIKVALITVSHFHEDVFSSIVICTLKLLQTVSLSEDPYLRNNR